MTTRILAVLGSLLLSLCAVTAPAQAADSSCDPTTDVVLFVDATELEGDTTTVCVPDAAGSTAIDLLDAAGLDPQSNATGMLCRIDSLPSEDDETCGSSLSGDGYWAFYTAEIDGDWSYAQVGPDTLEAAAGEFIGFDYTPMSETVPETPALELTQSSFDEAQPVAAAADDADGEESEEDSDDSPGVAIVVAVLLIVLIAAAAFVVSRRRKDA